MKGYIYQIKSPKGEQCYIGSTFQKLSARMTSHVSQYKQWKLGKANFVSSFNLFDEYGVENCQILLITERDLITKQDLSLLEFETIQNTDNVVNRNKGGYGTTHNIQEYRKLYRAQHGKRMNELTLKTNKRRVQCLCGHEHLKGNTFNHCRSKHHQRWEAEQEIMNIQWD